MTTPSEIYGRPWSEREYILVLDLYLNYSGRAYSPNSRLVKELAELMGRTPAAVCMRMENFASIDPGQSQSRRGLGNIAPLGRKMFDEWVGRPEHLKSCAEVFRREAEGNWSARTLFDPNPVAVPRAFGRYELLDLIGYGYSGSVFSCVDVETGARAALKIINAERVGDREVLHRFLREIRVLKCVEHASVIALYEDNLDTEDRFPGFVMELAEVNLTEYANISFGDRGTRPVLNPEVAVDIVRSICAACTALHVHSPKIVHRDINPNNILRLPSGRWVLADFGLAKFVGAAQVTTTFATRTHAAWGTAYYPAPEQYRDLKRADERTDVYALGVLVWELFTSSWPPLERDHHGLPQDLGLIFFKATERDPESRFKSAKEFLDALEETEVFKSIPIRPVGEDTASR